jgi:hypothetical protein
MFEFHNCSFLISFKAFQFLNAGGCWGTTVVVLPVTEYVRILNVPCVRRPRLGPMLKIAHPATRHMGVVVRNPQTSFS